MTSLHEATLQHSIAARLEGSELEQYVSQYLHDNLGPRATLGPPWENSRGQLT